MFYSGASRTAGRRPLLVAVAIALIAAACGADGRAQPSAASRAGGTTLPEISIPAATTTSTPAEMTSTAPTFAAVGDIDDPPPEELAFIAGDRPVTVTTEAVETTSAGSTPPTTSGSGAAPATTVAGGGGGDTSIYQGIVGSLDPDAIVAPAVAPPPAAVPGVLPLTGLAGEVPNRPAAVVKIDNGSRARPQSGLNAADIIVEEEVEGGITRFAAIFHSNPSIVGPIRSGRTTDIGIINGLGAPLLLYSGANAVTDALLRAQSTVQNRNAGTSSGYWRSSYRSAPSNLYSDTAPHWATATGGPPPPQFAYRAEGSDPGGVEDTSLTVSYPASRAGWTWDGSAWLRTQGGNAHMTASGEQVSAANVVIIEAREVPSGMVDSSGANVPEFVFVGTGPATVFTSGRRIDGVWTRPTLRSVATLTTADGTVIGLTPGRTWIELIGVGSGILG